MFYFSDDKKNVMITQTYDLIEKFKKKKKDLVDEGKYIETNDELDKDLDKFMSTKIVLDE